MEKIKLETMDEVLNTIIGMKKCGLEADIPTWEEYYKYCMSIRKTRISKTEKIVLLNLQKEKDEQL